MRHIPRWILLCSVAVAPLTAMAGDFEGLFKGHTLDEPGCAVGVSRQGQPVTYGSYGGADLEHAVPVTPDTIMETGSVSKQFTAASILLLAQDGKLALTDDIRKYLPEMPDYGTPITFSVTPAACATGAKSACWPGGRAQTRSIPIKRRFKLSRGKRRSTTSPARPTPIPTPASPSRLSSSSVSAASLFKTSPVSVSSRRSA